MRATFLLLAAVAAGCAAEPPGPAAAPSASGDARLPPTLRTLTLNEDHPTATPVLFDHGFHASARAMGGQVSCADCHHETKDKPTEIPRACGACHGHNFLAPVHDESDSHDHEGPPDL